MKKTLFLAFVLMGLFSVHAADVVLWEDSAERGGWRAFGNGMLAAKVEGDRISLAVDWVETSYGVGVVFEKDLPDLSSVKKLVVEARSREDNGTVLAPEWVAGQSAFRVAADRQAALTADWETYTFELPDDFPRLADSETDITALRLLFLNPQKPGRSDVYFRSARLEP